MLYGVGFIRNIFGPAAPEIAAAADLARAAVDPALVMSDRAAGFSTRATGDAPTPPPRPVSSSLSVEAALGITAVYRSVQIIVNTISQMALETTQSGRVIPSPALIRQPDSDDTARGFIEQTVFSLAAYGNAYWRLRRTSGGTVNDLKVLDPSTVTAVLNPTTGRISYHVNGTPVAARQIRHLRLMRRPGHAEGMGPIQTARGELGALLQLRWFADNWFSTGVPTGYLTSDQVLNSAQSAEYAEAWKKFLQDHAGVGVLSQGLKYQHLAVKPAEAQFLEVQQAAIVNVARLFGIPAAWLIAQMEGTSQTYSNLQDLGLVFLQTTAMGYVAEIEDALSSLLPKGKTVRMAEADLLRLDTVTKTEVRAAQIAAGIRSADEIRAEDGLDPLPEPAPPASTPDMEAPTDV